MDREELVLKTDDGQAADLCSLSHSHNTFLVFACPSQTNNWIAIDTVCREDELQKKSKTFCVGLPACCVFAELGFVDDDANGFCVV